MFWTTITTITNAIYLLHIVPLEWKYFDVSFIFVLIHEASLIDAWNHFALYSRHPKVANFVSSKAYTDVATQKTLNLTN